MTLLRVGVAVPAAGSGRRMGGRRKPMLLLDGRPILARSLQPFLDRDDVVAVVVALPEDTALDPPEWLATLDPRVKVVAGGSSRTASVARALEALPEDLDVIAVHDAARPLLTAAALQACLDVAAGGEGAVSGCPAVDTVKQVDADGRIVCTPDRTTLWYAYTPQVFPAAMVRDAYAGAHPDGASDDSALVEAAGGVVRMVDGGGGNPKVTRPEDLAVAEALLAGRGAAL